MTMQDPPMTPPQSKLRPPPVPQPAAPTPPGPDGLPEHHEPEITIGRSKFVQDVLPFLTSLAFHLGIIGLIVLAVGAREEIGKIIQQVREQVIVPDAAIEEGPVGGVKYQGLAGDPTRPSFQNKYPNIEEGFAQEKSDTMRMQWRGEGGSADAAGAVFGGSSNAVGMPGTGNTFGSGGGEPGGPLAPFGNPSDGGALGPKSTFIGVSGNARFVAFVCDASGSMLNRFDDLRAEISRTVGRMRPSQFFNVIFFQETSAKALDPNQLIQVTPENVKRAADFLANVSAAGSTDPLPGLEIAFRQQPQLIFLLTDGDFPDNEAVLAFIRQRNADKKVKINTIAFLNADETEYLKLLETIAKENGGVFKFVTEEDLGR